MRGAKDQLWERQKPKKQKGTPKNIYSRDSFTNPLQDSAGEGALQITFAVVFTPGTLEEQETAYFYEPHCFHSFQQNCLLAKVACHGVMSQIKIYCFFLHKVLSSNVHSFLPHFPELFCLFLQSWFFCKKTIPIISLGKLN